MRKLLSVSLVAVLTAVTAGCECWECFTQFEACKNQALFGSSSLCGSSYGAGYQCGTPCDCAGMVVQSPVSDCCSPGCGPSGCGASGCGPAGCGPAGCGAAPGMMVSPGQTYLAPGQPGQTYLAPPGQVITPSPTPGPENYAPEMR